MIGPGGKYAKSVIHIHAHCSAARATLVSVVIHTGGPAPTVCAIVCATFMGHAYDPRWVPLELESPCAHGGNRIEKRTLPAGRQHQIRVHCAHLGAAVANDDM